MFKALVDMGDLNSRGPSKSQIKFELRPPKKEKEADISKEAYNDE